MRGYSFSGKKYRSQLFGACFRLKEPVLQAVGREKADSDRELDREFTRTSTRNTPGINREIDREIDREMQ
ncbi:MAG: hypothetical protein EBS49_07590 [Verrucomicrobia bacterium]|nr:hypothetical protein [Verrucomicrobiota bacterium]NBU69454.1 hypothetical protein [Verrucomicrobiota bacterium]